MQRNTWILQKGTRVAGVLGVFLLPLFARAHEVYVLEESIVAQKVAGVSPNPFSVIADNPAQFWFWGFVAVVIISTVFAVSTWHRVEKIFNPFLMPLKHYAPLVARVTLGLALLASGLEQALFGPELALTHFGAASSFMQFTLTTAGVFVLLGLFTREAAFAGLVVYSIGVMYHGLYMVTYLNYLGEIILVLILGGGIWSLDRRLSTHHIHFTRHLRRWFSWLEHHSFLILRICFGAAIIFAAVYAKFLHSSLAVQTVVDYNLTNYFPFDPLFTVLGALIIETLAGLFFMLGIEIRWTSLFLLFWLTLSLLYFGEAVWPHVILIGVCIAFFMHGYDRYTLEGYFFKYHRREPVL